MTALNLQLWSYNYDPEPTGIAPVSTVWAQEMRNRGHQVEVVTAHPHYPAPVWGRRLLPYREVRDGIGVLRLPLWVGRASTAQRMRQEVTFACAQLGALPALSRPDLIVSVSPSFPALLPALLNVRLRRIPWVLWLHDILPDGAAASGVIQSGLVLWASRHLERAAYKRADRIVLLSRPFLANLSAKGVPETKMELIYDPATRDSASQADSAALGPEPRVLSMGNIGHSQGLAPLAAAFDRSAEIREAGARLIITGDGVAADDVRREISGDRVEMIGVVSDDRLEAELRSAALALVSQHYRGAEFNLPSKLMNFMTYGLPVIAAVNPQSEVARIVSEAGAGWVIDSSRPEDFPRKVVEVLADREEFEQRGAAGRAYARRHFSKQAFADRFDRLLRRVQRAGNR